MNKAETREVQKLTTYRTAGADNGMLARSLSAVIRSSRNWKTKADLRALAEAWGIAYHPEFII
jgi:hypothetical protein